MSSALHFPAPSRDPLRSLARAAAIASGAAVLALSPAGMAAADGPEDTTVVGTLVQAWAESLPAEAVAGHEHEGPLSWIEPVDGAPVRVDSADVAGVPVGSTVAVTLEGPVSDTDGEGSDETHDVLDAEIVAAPAVPSPPAVGAGLTNEVTVAMVAPAGSRSGGDGTTLGQLTTVVNGPVADFWSEQSNGAIRVGVTATHNWLDAAADCSKPGVLWDEVAARVGFVPGPGRHLLLYVSRQSDCAYALAEVGAQPASGGRLYVRDTTASVISHELGHNFGLGHSSGRQCDGAVEAGSCRTTAYRDFYDVMGVSWSQLGSLNVAQAARIGVLPAAAQQSLSVWGGGATVTLAPLSGGTGTRGLRLTDADGADYWLEYRTPAARDAWLGTANPYRLQSGVLLRRAGAGLPDTSLLLDGTPAATSGWDTDLQAALPVGVPVPVSGGDFTVVVESSSAAGAVVSVTPAPPAGAPAPGPAPVAQSGGVMAGSAASAAAPDATAAVPAAPAPLPAGAATVSNNQSLATAADTTGISVVVLVAGSALAGCVVLLALRLRGALRRIR